jgi:4'-phosphopantetheinyl transferase EntD
VIEQLIPPPAATAHAFDDPADAFAALYPQEADAVARAVPKRQREYATVRLCARRAMSELGVEPVPLLAGRRGAPQWPSGVIGSLTHCDG